MSEEKVEEAGRNWLAGYYGSIDMTALLLAFKAGAAWGESDETPAACEAGRDVFDDWLPLTARRIAPGEYEILTAEGHRLWYMEGAALAEWVCATINSRPALDALREWRQADEAMTEKDRELGVAVMLHERVTLDDSRELARLKAVEFGKRNALRAAAAAALKEKG
jgi:hypothetical protein